MSTECRGKKCNCHKENATPTSNDRAILSLVRLAESRREARISTPTSFCEEFFKRVQIS